jgi:hypothetical protein
MSKILHVEKHKLFKSATYSHGGLTET